MTTESGSFSGEVLYSEDQRDQTGGNALLDDVWVTLAMTRAPAEHSRLIIRIRTDHIPGDDTVFTWVDGEEIDSDVWSALALTVVADSTTNLTSGAIEATMARRASTTIGDTALTVLTIGKVSDTEMCLLIRNASEFNPARIQIIEELPTSGPLASAAQALAAGCRTGTAADNTVAESVPADGHELQFRPRVAYRLQRIRCSKCTQGPLPVDGAAGRYQ